MKKSILSVISISLLSAGITAMAAQDDGQASQAATATEKPAQAMHDKADSKYHTLFVKLDKNKDGYIDKTEAKHDKPLEKVFAKVSHKGKMDEADFAAWETARRMPKKK